MKKVSNIKLGSTFNIRYFLNLKYKNKIKTVTVKDNIKNKKCVYQKEIVFFYI